VSLWFFYSSRFGFIAQMPAHVFPKKNGNPLEMPARIATILLVLPESAGDWATPTP
jgi:hypothetical protein